MAVRGEFSSRIGFILAAAGSAVGLGNIWGFPTQVASNGGAAFVLVYLMLAFALAYPVLMAELIIGRAHRANMVDSLGQITSNPLVNLTLATFRMAELGFFGVVVYTRVQTPRFCGQACKCIDFCRATRGLRGFLISCCIVGIFL